MGITQHIAQGEGGEQSDQHKFTVEAQARLSENLHLFAFLDDVYITNQRARSLKVTLLWKRSFGPTQAHRGKNRSVEPWAWSLRASRS